MNTSLASNCCKWVDETISLLCANKSREGDISSHPSIFKNTYTLCIFFEEESP